MHHAPLIAACLCLALAASAQSDDIAKKLLWLDGRERFPFTGKLLLAQNAPNPVAPDGETVIAYRLADGAPASLIVYNASRKAVLRFDGLAAGNGHISIKAGQLQPGTYTYALVVHGRRVQRRRLVVAG